MNIYIAACYERHPEMREVATRLESLGYTVTSRWIRGDHECELDMTCDEHARQMAMCAMKDIEDLLLCDAILSFSNPTDVFNRGGRHVEFGIASATGKRRIVIGRRENIFHYLPRVEVYPTLDAFLETER